jgi:hypothetical protein
MTNSRMTNDFLFILSAGVFAGVEGSSRDIKARNFFECSAVRQRIARRFKEVQGPEVPAISFDSGEYACAQDEEKLIRHSSLIRISGFGFRILPLLLLMIASGCATRVYPPANPANPTTICLCDYGVHSSVLLPNGDGRFVEYVYGDWAYAVMDEDDPMHTLGALLVSLQPALGRRFLTPKPGETYPMPPNHPHTVWPMLVDSQKVAEVVSTLDARFDKHKDTAMLNPDPDYGFLFVRDDEHYSVLHNCNHMTVSILQAVGCGVGGFPIFSNFIMELPGGPFPAKPPPMKPGRDN